MTHIHSDSAMTSDNALPLMSPKRSQKRSQNRREHQSGSAYSMLLAPDKTGSQLPVDQSVARAADRAHPSKVELLGMDFDNLTKHELLAKLRKGVVFTPNVDHLMKLRRDPDFVAVYEQADFKVCDSQVLMYASHFLGKPLKAKLSGSDLLPWFCDYHSCNEDMKIFLLGGRDGVAREARYRINMRTGREIVIDEYSPPFGFEKDPVECARIVEMVERSPANVLVVCLGAPKQERWIANYRHQLPSVDIFMAVGAAVDFEAGCKPRAPKYVSELGLEWLYRLLCEPRRLWRRYLVEGMPFLGLVLVEKAKQLRFGKA